MQKIRCDDRAAACACMLKTEQLLNLSRKEKAWKWMNVVWNGGRLVFNADPAGTDASEVFLLFDPLEWYFLFL